MAFCVWNDRKLPKLTVHKTSKRQLVLLVQEYLVSLDDHLDCACPQTWDSTAKNTPERSSTVSKGV